MGLRKITRTACLLAALLFAGGAHASSVTIDFNSYTTESGGTQINSSGYAFSLETPSAPIFSVTDDFFGSGGTQALGYGDSNVIISRQDGGLFNLESIDLYQWDLECSGWAYTCDKAPYTIQGLLENGTTITFEAVGLADNSWSTIELTSEWSDLQSVTISGSWRPVEQALYYGTFDNVVVANVIPLPPAIWLMLSALGMLAGSNRLRERGNG